MGSQLVPVSDRFPSTELGGLRGELRATAIAHVRDSPDEVRELLRPGVKRFAEVILKGVERGDRTCVRLYPELMGMVGAKQDVVQALVIAVGAQSPEHLRSAASTALDAEAVDDETAYAQALEFVNEYRKERGLPALVEVPPEESGEVPGA